MDLIPYYDASGNAFYFSLALIWNPPRHGGGVYAFCELINGIWTPYYVGRTCDFGARFDEHHKRWLAVVTGATHVLVHYESREWAQKDLEATMVAHLNPRLNEVQPKGLQRRPLPQFFG